MIGNPPFFLAVSLLDYDKWFPVYWVCARTFEKRRGFIWPYDLTCVHDVYDPADNQRNPFGSRCQTVSVDKVQILKFYSQIGSTCQLPWNPILKQQTTVWLILSSRANSRDGLMKLTSNHKIFTPNTSSGVRFDSMAAHRRMRHAIFNPQLDYLL